MSHLPVIVGFGGISPAGRSALHYGYRRLVFDQLPHAEQQQTLQNLAVLTGALQHGSQGWVDEAGNSVQPEAFLAAHKCWHQHNPSNYPQWMLCSHARTI